MRYTVCLKGHRLQTQRNIAGLGLKWLLSLCIALPQALLISSAQAETSTNALSRQEVIDKAAIQKEGLFLEQAILGEATYHPLDTFRLLAQEAQDLIGAGPIDLKAVSLDILDENGKLIKSLSQLNTDSFTNQGSNKYFFQLSYQGRVFSTFKMPIKAIAFQSNKIIFLEEGRESQAENVTELQFIDLKAYKLAIGKTALPVFRLPVESSAARFSFEALNKKSFEVNGAQVNADVVEVFSQPQQMAFNFSVSISDVITLDDAQPLLDDIQSFFEKSIELEGQKIASSQLSLQSAQSHLLSISDDINKNLKGALESKSPAANADSVALMLKDQFSADRDKKIDQISKSIIEERGNQRKLFARIKLLRAAFQTPRPMGAPKLVQAMTFVASGIQNKSRFDLGQALRHLGSSKSLRMGLAVSSGLALGSLYPSEAAAFLYGSLDTSRTVFDVALGGIKNLGTLSTEAVKATFAGFNPVIFSSAYLSEDKLPHLGVGLTALFTALYLAIGVPHIMANSYYLVRDLAKVSWKEKIAEEKSIWTAIKTQFISRQKNLQKDYINALAKDASQGIETSFSAEDDIKVEQIINGLEQNSKKSLFAKFFSKLANKKPAKVKGINSFAAALRHFFFSYATFTISGKAYTALWNSWFGLRSFVWSPMVVASVLMYPNLWGNAVSGRLPSKFNGGLRTRVSTYKQLLLNRSQLTEMRAIEDQLAKVEDEISAYALRASFKALADYAKNSKDLQLAYANARSDKLTSETLDKLTTQQRSFFRSYYEQAMNSAMTQFLQQKSVFDAIESQQPNLVDKSKLTINRLEAQALVGQVTNTDLYQQAQRAADSPLQYKALSANLKTKLVTQLDAKRNRQVARIQSVQRQAQKPQAMARAVRSMIASNLIDKPLELMFTFACLAGITSGVLMPLQPEMHSENSWFYLSKMVFSNGFIYGVIAGVFADIWMKLQQDELHEGQFDKVPEGDDAKGSFFKYYMKQAFKNPENSLWKNQKHNWKIVWANMKAAFTSILFINLITLGRLDLDAYIVGYLFVFMTPLSGFAYKLEQGFELAANYFAKDIPEEYRSHPKSQEYLNKVISRKRLKFNLFYKTYENIMGYLVFSFQQMSTPQFGSRSFSRVLLGGYTWTELAVGGLEKASSALQKVPGASKIIDSCSYLLSNNYTDFEKFKPKK